MLTIGPCHGSAGRPSMALAPSTAPSWMTRICTRTPRRRRRSDSAAMAAASSRNVRPAVASAAHELGRRLDGGADDPDAHAVDDRDRRTVEPVRGLAGGRLDDVRREEREVGPFLMLEDALQPEVELVVAVRRGIHAPGVLDVDRRRVVEQRRVRRRRADVVTGGHEHALVAQQGGFLVEHRRQRGGAADADVEPVLQRRRRIQLAMEVGQPDHVDRPVATAVLQQRQQHLTLAVLRHRHAEQERRRRRQIDAAHGLARDATTDRRTVGEERRPHVRVARRVVDVGHVAVLTEERGPGDQRAGRGGVELVRRRGEHDEVARARRVGHVRRAARTVGDEAGRGLGERPVDDVEALRLPVAGPVVGILEGDRRPPRSGPPSPLRRRPGPVGTPGWPGRARPG